MTELTSVLFDKKKWSTARARYWLKKHKLKPIKRVHATKRFYRYRLKNPRNYRRLRTKKVGKNITLIIGFKK